jgi:hypothetical protein
MGKPPSFVHRAGLIVIKKLKFILGVVVFEPNLIFVCHLVDRIPKSCASFAKDAISDLLLFNDIYGIFLFIKL